MYYKYICKILSTLYKSWYAMKIKKYYEDGEDEWIYQLSASYMSGTIGSLTG